MTFAEFLLSVFASLVAAIVVVLITAATSVRARWVLTGVLGRMLDVEIDAVFGTKKDAEDDLSRELGRARDIAIITGRGNELQRDTFDPLFLRRPANTPLRVRILLPTSAPALNEYDWTKQRQRELATFDSAFRRDGLLAEQIDNNVRFLEEYSAAGAVELRRFNSPHVGRIVLTERCVYFTPYRSDTHGRDNTVFKFRRGEMYDSFHRLFEQLWEAGKPTADIKS